MNDAQASLNKAVAANPSFEPARSKLAALGALPAVADAAVQPEAELITASITAPEQIVRKETLPEAVKPPLQLVGDLPVQMVRAVPVKPAKLIDDRIPPEEGPQFVNVEPAAAQAGSPQKEEGSDYTLQVDAIPQPNEALPRAVKPKPQTEQIVAVEALPEPETQAKLEHDRAGGERCRAAEATI